jgi:hypothetical protein
MDRAPDDFAYDIVPLRPDRGRIGADESETGRLRGNETGTQLDMKRMPSWMSPDLSKTKTGHQPGSVSGRMARSRLVVSLGSSNDVIDPVAPEANPASNTASPELAQRAAPPGDFSLFILPADFAGTTSQPETTLPQEKAARR